MKRAESRVLRAAVAVAVAFGMGSAYADIPASAYVQDGLVVQFDASAALREGKLANLGSAGSTFDLTPVTEGTDKVADGWIHTETGWWMPQAAATAVTGGGYTVEYYGKQTGNGDGAATYFYAVGSSQTDASNSSGENAPFRIGSKGKDSKEMCIAATTASWSSNANSLKPTGSVNSSVAATRTGTIDVGTKTISYFENGVKINSAANAGTVNSGIKRINLGDLRAKRGCYWKGDFGSVRIYNRALTAEEIAINSNIDKIRFEGTDPATLTWPEGYRWNSETGEIEARLAFSGADGATVSLDNETFAASVDGWFAPNQAVTVYARPAAGRSIAVWQGLPTGAMVSDDKASATFVLSVPLSVSVVSRAPMALRWRGTKSALASDVANWVTDDGESAVVLPIVSGDAVHLDKDSPSMTWDLDGVTLASWTQDADYAGTVTFLTGPIHEGVESPTHGVLSADGKRRELIVTGDITLNGGVWKHTSTPSLAETHPGWISGEGVYRLIARAGGNFSVAESVTLAANGGFRSEQGPGYRGGNGACHGGAGGGNTAGATAYISLPYGKVRAPVTIGSGGGSSVGGGAIEVSAAGTFTLNGTLDASAVTTTSWYSAAGGSVYLSAGYLTGSGSVLAQPTVPKNGSCGAGGRIALVLSGEGATFDGFTGTLDCRGRMATSHSGTIYKETPADKADGGVLEIAGSGSTDTGSRGLYTLLQDNGEDYHFASIMLTNKVLLGIGPNVAVSTRRLVAYGTANVISMVGGTLEVPDGYVFTNVSLRSEFNPSTITTPAGAEGTNVLAKGVTFTMEPEVTFGGTLVMKSGSTITHTANGATDKGYRANFNAENLIIEEGASVTLAGKGFSSAKGPGCPQDDGKTDRSGSHGGLAVDVGSVKAYGSITRPVTLGSGGKSAAGAGATHIKIKHRTVVNGSISATASDWYYVGAAGSVWLETGSLKGEATGSIVANGWHQGYNNNYYGGGGGRVAVTLTDAGSDFSEYLGTIQANGVRYYNSDKGFASGSGTVYLRQNGEPENDGTLVVDGVTGSFGNDDNFTDVTDAMTECLVGHVVITNSGNLRVRKGAELQVRKSFKNVSRFREGLVNGEAGDGDHAPGAVSFVDASVDAKVTGTNVFMCLKCVTPGKTVRFGAAADTWTGIADGGILSVGGSENAPVYLRGLFGGTAWLLDFRGKADVTYADVMDSDASSGDKVSVDDTNKDSGNNLNWGFVGVRIGDTNVWHGAQSTSWAASGNWSLDRSPVDTDVVRIPADAHCQPELTEAITLNRLEIAAGKSLMLNGFSLTATNGVDCQGAIVCAGSETVKLDGDVILKGFTAANSTLVLADTRSRSVNLGGQSFNVIVASGAEPELSFMDGFSASKLTISCTAAKTVAFWAGQTVTVGEFAFSGVVDDAAALTLKSGSTGQAWYLNVTGKGAGSGVIVSDSHAAGGQTVFAHNPSTPGNNVTGWVFGIGEATWTGGESGNWSEPSNWSGDAVPDADTCVHFTSDATVTLDVDDATAQIFDIAGCTVNLKGAKTLKVTSLLEILDGGTLNQASSGNVVRVEGSAYVRTGGVWTHEMNGTADASWKVDNGYGINGVIKGDFVIEAGGKVTAYGKGYHYGYGPGCMSGSSHGARWKTANGVSKPCYGSMFTPDLLGSGGVNGNAASGGGRVRLVVGGKLTVDGSIDAQGETQGFYNASGGSVWITCGSLAGSGEVQANGANKSSYYDTGCGGRVAVYQTTAAECCDFTEGKIKITAYGGVSDGIAGARPERPAGTVYLQLAGEEDRCGTVFVRNNQSGAVVEVGGVDLPVTNLCPETVKSYRGTTFDLSNGGIMTIVADVTIKELELSSAARLNLDGHTLTIRSWAHNKGKGWPSNWQTAIVYPGADSSGNPGRIVWAPRPLTLIVR